MDGELRQKTKSDNHTTTALMWLFLAVFVAGVLSFSQGFVSEGSQNIASVPMPKPAPRIEREEDYNPCKTGTERECVDKCVTTYIKSGNRRDIQLKSCGVGTIDEIKMAMDRLVFCAADKKVPIKPSNLRSASCFVYLGDRKNKTFLEMGKLKLLEQRCPTEVNNLKKVIDERYKKAVKTKASKSQANACADRGVVNCIKNPSVLSEDDYTCWPKKDGYPYSRGYDDYDFPTETQEPNAGKKWKFDLGKLLGGLLKGGGFGGGGGGSVPRDCGSYYYRLNNPEACEKPEKPTCLLLVNKTDIKKGEAVKVEWQTQYASEGVEITTSVGEDINTVSQNGEITIYPRKSGTITLTGKGKINEKVNVKENNCTDSVSINVDGETVEGDYPPSISCSPSSVEKGKKTRVTVQWACAAGEASGSRGINLDTENKIKGETEVRVSDNIKYEVECLNKSGKVIGKNSCTVMAETPLFDIMTWPTSAKEGERIRVSWGSIGMKSCRVVGPNNFSYSDKAGVVVTVPFPEGSNKDDVVYTAECVSKFDKKSTKDIVVEKLE